MEITHRELSRPCESEVKSEDKKVLWFSWNLYILYIMYIPITKTEEKCAGQLSYGFNIKDKLEGCTHEKKIPYGDLDFWKFVYQSIWIIIGESMVKFWGFFI